MRRAASIAARQAAMAQQSQETKAVSPKMKRQASAKAGPVASAKPTAAASTTKPDENTKKSEVKPAAEQVLAPVADADVPRSEPSALPPLEAEVVDNMAVDEADCAVEGMEELDPASEETVMEETIRVTRAKLRRRAAAEGPAGN